MDDAGREALSTVSRPPQTRRDPRAVHHRHSYRHRARPVLGALRWPSSSATSSGSRWSASRCPHSGSPPPSNLPRRRVRTQHKVPLRGPAAGRTHRRHHRGVQTLGRCHHQAPGANNRASRRKQQPGQPQACATSTCARLRDLHRPPAAVMTSLQPHQRRPHFRVVQLLEVILRRSGASTDWSRPTGIVDMTRRDIEAPACPLRPPPSRQATSSSCPEARPQEDTWRPWNGGLGRGPEWPDRAGRRRRESDAGQLEQAARVIRAAWRIATTSTSWMLVL